MLGQPLLVQTWMLDKNKKMRAIASLEQLQKMGITLIDRPNGETSIVH